MEKRKKKVRMKRLRNDVFDVLMRTCFCGLELGVVIELCDAFELCEMHLKYVMYLNYVMHLLCDV